jgi:hypothetical protein
MLRVLPLCLRLHFCRPLSGTHRSKQPLSPKDIIVHINSLDELLWKLEYPQPIEEMVMVKEDRLAVPLTQEKAIEIVDLRRQVRNRVNFDFTGNPTKLQLLYFPER